MYFVFSKILLFTIIPLNWIIILTILSFIIKKPKLRLRLRVAAALIFLVFSSPALFKLVQYHWDIRPVDIGSKHYKCAIVLGGFSSFDQHGHGYFNFSADRFIQAAKMKLSGHADYILISGGSGNLIGNKVAEAPWVRNQLLQFSVPDSAILVEDHSKNTKENAEFSKKILDAKHISGPYLLVTSAFHMRRATYLYTKTGMDVQPYPCNYFTADDEFLITDLIPDIETLSSWNYYNKEFVGYVVAHLQK